MLVAALTPSARAQSTDLAHAVAAYRDADFPGARAAFESVLRESTTLDRTTAAEAHRYLAAIGLVLGEPAVAERHARAAVALAPRTSPVRGAPAEAEPMFRRAREALAGDPLRLSITPRPAGRGIELRMRPNVAALDVLLVLRCDDGARQHETRGPPPTITLDLDTARSGAACTARAVNPAGAALLRARFHRDPSARPATERASSPWPWIVGLGGAGVAAAVGIVLAVVLAEGDEAAAPHFRQTVVVGWR